MSFYTIDVPFQDPYPTFEVQLDGTNFAFDLEWNVRAGLWFMNLYLPQASGERTPITTGQAMVAQRPLLLGITHPDRPLGELVIRGERDPGRLDWNTYCVLMYVDQESLGALDV
jgi:hypothetical protein